MPRKSLASSNFLRVALRSAPTFLLLFTLPQLEAAKAETREVNGQFCTYKETSVIQNLDDFTTLGSDATDLWVGAILDVNTNASRGPQVGSLRQKNLPDGIERKPYKVVFNGNSINVTSPSLSGYESAWSKLSAKKSLKNVGAGDITFKLATANSVKASLASVGISASGSRWQVTGNMSTTSTKKTNSIALIFIQTAPPVKLDFGAGSAASGLLSSGQTLPADWLNSAGYVSSINYGRILIIQMTSAASIEDLNIIAQAAYKGTLAKVKVKGKTNASDLLASADWDFKAFGGTNETATAVVDAIKSGKQTKVSKALKDYFTGRTEIKTLQPLLVNLNSFANNSTVTSATTLKRISETCTIEPPGSTLVNIKYRFFLKKADDGNDDEVYGNFYVNGKTPAGWIYTNSGKYKQMNKGTTITMHEDKCYPVKTGARDKTIVDVDVKLWDYDSGSGNDSIFGRLTRQFDFSQAARAIKEGAPIFRNFDITNADGNKVTIEFSKPSNQDCQGS